MIRPPAAARLPPLRTIRHPGAGETVATHRGQDGYHPIRTRCSPESPNSRLSQPPTEDDIAAMQHGALIGWDRLGTNPNMWRRSQKARP